MISSGAETAAPLEHNGTHHKAFAQPLLFSGTSFSSTSTAPLKKRRQARPVGVGTGSAGGRSVVGGDRRPSPRPRPIAAAVPRPGRARGPAAPSAHF